MTRVFGEASASVVWSSVLFATCLLGVAAVLYWLNRRSWRHRQSEELEPAAIDFFERQYRRRRQVNMILAVIAVAIVLGIWIRIPVVSVLYWAGVVLLVGWIGLLALLDFISSCNFFQDVRADQRATREALSAEIERLKSISAGQSSDGNGRHPQD
jgi:Na+/H+ antiporter NhaC